MVLFVIMMVLIKEILNNMKTIKFIILILVIFLTSCCQKNEEVVKEKDDFLKVYEYVDYKHSSKENIVNDNESYWWVLVEDKDQEIKRNSFIKQNHSYFSYAEAKQEIINGSGKDCFILNIVRVDKETYEHNVDE